MGFEKPCDSGVPPPSRAMNQLFPVMGESNALYVMLMRFRGKVGQVAFLVVS